MSEMEFTLGWELEANRGATRTPSGVVRAGDGSVSGEGIEYRINRSLVRDRAASLQRLKQLSLDSRLQTNSSCGFHVHVGLMKKSRKAAVWVGWFVTLARTVEDMAFLAVPESRQDNRYCLRWGSTIPRESIIKKRYSGEKYDNEERYFWLNPVEMFRPQGIRTVENRLLGETHRWPYLLAWVSCTYMMADRAWRLIDDPSMLPAYAQEIRQSFKRIQEYIRKRSPYSAFEAWEMAKQSRLIDTTRPLEKLAMVEDRIRRQVETAEASLLFNKLEAARNTHIAEGTRESIQQYNAAHDRINAFLYGNGAVPPQLEPVELEISAEHSLETSPF